MHHTKLTSAVVLAGRVRRKLKKLVGMAPPLVSWPGGVVSFTFDDFPKSALQTGGEILEQYGVRGTYYVAAGLAGRNGPVGPMFELADIREVHDRGHEIACHTFHHLRCSEMTRRTLAAEVQANRLALCAQGEDLLPTNFAYPYGAISPYAEHVLGSKFASCRGIEPGLNLGILNRSHLRANRIYDLEFDRDEIRALIDQNAAASGWLIFFTHDVVDAPSQFGCKPDQLTTVLELAARTSQILPVRDVLARLPKIVQQRH